MWLCQIAFARKGLSSADWQYSNINREALGILHGFIKFHHYTSPKEVTVITDHKPLVTMISKDMAMLSQWLQHIRLYICQYSIHILCKPGPELT